MNTTPAPFAPPRAPLAPVFPTAVAPAPGPLVAAPPVPQTSPQTFADIEDDDGDAIAVSALFEDAVLAVRHLDDPRGGTVTPATRGLLGGAAAALVAVLVLFLSSYAQVAREKASGAAVRHGAGVATDVAAAALGVFGLGAAFAGLWRRERERRENGFTIGPDPAATFPAPQDGLPVARFPLLRSTGADYELLYTSAMTGTAEVKGRRVPLSDLARGAARPVADLPGALAVTVPSGARFDLRLGELTFAVQSVPRPRRLPVPLAIDWGTQSYTGAVFVAVALFLVMIFSVPPDPRSLALDAFLSDARLARFVIRPETVKDELPAYLKRPEQTPAGGKRADGATGTMGKRDAPRADRRYDVIGPRDNRDIRLPKDVARDAAKDAGVLGIIHANQHALSALLGRDESALGNAAAEAMGHLIGAESGDAFGSDGRGLVGVDNGGGGTGDRTLGTGDLGTIGRSRGPGGDGYGRTKGILGPRKPTGPEVVPGTAEVKGSLDKELIRRVIRRHLPEVKFCYERELTRNAALTGRVLVQFTIGSTGAVVSSVVQGSTLGNPAAEQCISSAVRRWEFPQPQGGIVIVTYPFVLKAAAE